MLERHSKSNLLHVIEVHVHLLSSTQRDLLFLVPSALRMTRDLKLGLVLFDLERVVECTVQFLDRYGQRALEK
jgi:hypothetical protein